MKKTLRFPIVIACVLALLIAALLFSTIKNQMAGGRLDDLNETDQAVLSEYNTLCASLAEEELWDGYHLEDETVFAMPGDWGGGYLINPIQPVSSIFAKKIETPDNWTISVYRIAATEPGLMQFRLDGSINTIGKSYSLLGNDVYYVKYDEASSVAEPWSNMHFSTFLTHESFHYFMQENWQDGSRFSTDELTDRDIKLLGQEYSVLAQVQEQLLSGTPDEAVLQEAAHEYVRIMDQRLAANPEYVQQELGMETTEGTATYIGIQASRRIGYDYGVMYFSNKKDVSFNDIIPQYQARNIDKSMLADRIPYETGALICLLMDELGILNWQATLNEQTPDSPATLYDILKHWSESQI